MKKLCVLSSGLTDANNFDQAPLFHNQSEFVLQLLKLTIGNEVLGRESAGTLARATCRAGFLTLRNDATDRKVFGSDELVMYTFTQATYL